MDKVIPWIRRHPYRTAGIASGATLVGGYAFLKSKSEDIPRDIRSAWSLVKILRSMHSFQQYKGYEGRIGNWTTTDFWKTTVASYGPKEGLIYIEDTIKGHENVTRRSDLGLPNRYSFIDMDVESNKIAFWASEVAKIAPGSVVALIMENRPEFILTWLGLTKAGIVTALINTNLKNEPLKHSLVISGANTFIIGDEFLATFSEEFRSKFKGTWHVRGGGGTGIRTDFDTQLAKQTLPPAASLDNILASRRKEFTPEDSLLYIYTSGTTGKPKAAKINHVRFWAIGAGFCTAYSIESTDRIFCCLPLYHSSGGVVCVSESWTVGAALIVKRKFSTSTFWSDIQLEKATVFQYIGEMCRYLLSAYKSDPVKNKKWENAGSGIKVCVGNGLRPDIWDEFQKTFGIGRVGEFYGSTEGNVALMNVPGKTGAVGWVSPLFTDFLPNKIVKFDYETEEPIRDPKTGFCIVCKANETGELLGKIEDDGHNPLRRFHGYTNQQETNRKILRDVFVKGDNYFRTGDLLRKDEGGYYFFVDRVGDTFRWKGENVATTEVAAVIGEVVKEIYSINVYGVKISERVDGKAGMALVTYNSASDEEAVVKRIYQAAKDELPEYARPMVLRMRKDATVEGAGEAGAVKREEGEEMTSTMKMTKSVLKREGWDPKRVEGDSLWWRDERKGEFVRVSNTGDYERIVREFEGATTGKPGASGGAKL